MPRTIDHDSRRTELLAAVWRIVLRGGVSDASVRTVAAEAGLSPGSVRYFFSDQRELLHAALREVSRRVYERVVAATEERQALVAQGRTAEAVTQLLAELLPLDRERLTEAQIWFAFAAHDAADETVRSVLHELDEGMRQVAEHGIASLIEVGEFGAGRKKATETTLLLAVLDGMTLRLLLHPDTLKPDAAVRALREHIDQLASPVK